MTENWLPVVGYEGYYSVSDQGRVRGEDRQFAYNGRWGLTTRIKRGKVLSQKFDPAGYPTVALSKNGKTTAFRVHVLLLKAFVGPRPDGGQGRHLDDNKSNNVLENLCWGSALENSQDKYRNGKGNQHLHRTHCVNGHELVAENIYPNRRARTCKICARARAREHFRLRKTVS